MKQPWNVIFIFLTLCLISIKPIPPIEASITAVHWEVSQTEYPRKDTSNCVLNHFITQMGPKNRRSSLRPRDGRERELVDA